MPRVESVVQGEAQSHQPVARLGRLIDSILPNSSGRLYTWDPSVLPQASAQKHYVQLSTTTKQLDSCRGREKRLTRAISKISVEKLFGRYDYAIELDSEGVEANRIHLLYGDNGTGKTTILKLIFHLLSPHSTRGHRSYIAKTPFTTFSISFSDHSQISATRAPGTIVGNYRLEITGQKQPVQAANVEVDPRSGAVGSEQLTTELQGVLRELTKFSLDVFYLGDTRDLEGDSLPETERRYYRQDVPSEMHEMSAIDHYDTFVRQSTRRSDSTLVESILRTEHWLRSETIRVSSIGETDARQSYADILRTVATAEAPAGANVSEELERLKTELKRLEDLSRAFGHFGLGPPIEADPLLNSLTLASRNKVTLPMMIRVLQLFLDGQNARLNALRDIFIKMRRFVEITNAHLVDKEVIFNVQSGLSIKLSGCRSDLAGEELDPDLLSSGERHLLLVFLNVLAASDGAPLFIIDEPELSLNVKWQRSLVESLLNLSQNTNCQFLMATHSIELLSQHMHRVVPLR